MDCVSRLTGHSWLIKWFLGTSYCKYKKDGNLYIYSAEKSFKCDGHEATYKLHLKCAYKYSTLSMVMEVKFDEEGIAEEDCPEAVIVVFQNNVAKMAKSNEGNANTVTWTSSTRNPVKFLNECVLSAIFQFLDPSRVCCHLLDHWSKLLVDPTFADVTFVVKGREIRAHSAIVSSSPVMAAMFKEGFKESQTRTVQIDDIDEEVFRELLRYLYTGRVQSLDINSTAEKLLTAAEKYQIDGLKPICERRLMSGINLENAIRLLVIGHLHSVDQLVELSLKCLAQNRRNVWSLPEWKDLMKNYPKLFLKASEHMAF